MRALFLLAFLLFTSFVVSGQDYYAQEFNLEIVETCEIDLFHEGGAVSFVDWNNDGFNFCNKSSQGPNLEIKISE